MMRIRLSTLPAGVHSALRIVGEVADEHGLSVWLVGGMVRDLLMGCPSLDADVVAEGDGIAFAGLLARRLGGKMLAHRRFGTAVLDTPDGVRIDVVSARRETYAQPGVLPDVVFGQLADDLFRRDFTINAIAASLNRKDLGVLRDDFDGVKDLRKGLVRIMHYRSFVDDPTRILRAVRYEKRFGFRLEPRTLSALKAACQEDAFTTISPVRYFNDFQKILEEKDPVAPLRRLRFLDGLRYFSFGPAEERLLEKIMRVQRDGAVGMENVYPVWIPRLAGLLSFLEPGRGDSLMTLFNIPRKDRQKISHFLHFLSVPGMFERLRRVPRISALRRRGVS